MNFLYTTKTTISKPIIQMMPKPMPVTYIGAGTITKTADILEMNQTKKVLIITDHVLNSLGLLKNMLAAIEAANISYVIYDEVKPDPTFAIVEEALSICKKNHCGAVIAVGGGSVLDTAKAVAGAYSNNVSPQKLAGLLKVKKRCLPLIAVPTTAGTGSEVTVAAVISDSQTHQKFSLIDPKLVPSYAILDPELTIGLPAHITAFTAMDALTHALEAWVSDYATEETDHYAKIAVTLIYENLEKVYHNPSDIKGREALLVASLYAGMAFTRTYVGYVHAFAHSIGGKFGVPHGLANAVLLPHVMSYYQDKSCSRFAELAKILHLGNENTSDALLSQKFIDSLFKLNATVGVPERLEKFDKNQITSVIDQAFKECHGTYPVPKFFSKKDAQSLLSKVSL